MSWAGLAAVQAQVQPLLSSSIDLRTDSSRQLSVQLLSDHAQQNKSQAESVARQRGWSTSGVLPGGRRFELMEVASEGPLYYITHNANAAISTAADRIRNTAPYNVNGNGFIVGVWDGGAVMSNHQEFGVRVLIKDGAAVADHATHVAGTIGAAGVVASAMGMAPNVGIDSYDWNNDLGEMTARAATGPNQAGRIHLSNHSYGFIRGWEMGSYSGAYGPHWFGSVGEREDRNFGNYNTTAASLDALHYSAPYFLAFKSAGNDRNDDAPASGTTYYYLNNGVWTAKSYNPATDPLSDGADAGGYDTMEQQAGAKNIMTVGAVNDAVAGGVRFVAAGTMSDFSNWGPTDDGRIKPDIVANGVALYSPVDTAINSYASYSGTSMSTPNASGTAALLIDYYAELLPAQAMRASTLKGLMIHTADDIGNPGPDYANGWGLINAKAAADQIRSHALNPASRFLHEGLLNVANPSETFFFNWDGVSAIRATLCWTDPAGSAKSGLDNRSPALVNDLDLRIVDPNGSTTYYPFVLNVNTPSALATRGDNVVDNVEQVLIPAPVSGTYRLTISHKGTLSGGQQNYSLILNGQSLASPNTVSVVATDAVAGEAQTGDGAGVFTFTRTGSTTGTLTVNFTVGGTATAGVDYVALGSTVTFAAGAVTATKQVDVIEDTAIEGDETVTLTLAAGAGYTLGSPATAAVTIRDDDSATAALVTSFVTGTVRNNYSGWVGLQVRTGGSAVTVTELGRLMLSGNSGTHTVKLVRASDGQDVAGGAVTLTMSGGTAGQIKYATLASPVVLTANTAYYLLTQETFGGDTWCDLNTTVTTTGVATVPTAAYGTGPGAWFPFGNANQSYGPVSFRYATGGGGGLTRVIGLSGNLAFGYVPVGEATQRTLTIANTGNASLTVSGIGYPNGFSGDWSGGTIAAGASQTVTVTFAPTQMTNYSGNITVTSDATAGTNTIAASGGGMVIATRIIELSGGIAFGNVTVGGTRQRTLTIGNTGNASLTVSGISYPTGFSGNWAGGAIAAGASQQVTVTFAPTVSMVYSGTISVASDATAGSNTISVSGTGFTFTRIIGLSGNLTFGDVTVGATLQRTLTITNTGDLPLTVSGIGYPSGFSGDWSGGAIAAGASQTVTVTFAPTLVTNYSGNITVTSDATAGTNTIAVAGTGITAQTTALVTSFIAGTVRNNYSGWVGLQVRTGGSAVTVTELGRLMLSGNSGMHTVKLVRASDGQDVAGGAVTLTMSGGIAGQIKYATLASPVVLTANTAYYLLTQETFGGDTWCDLNTTVTTTGVATVPTAAYGTGPGEWFPFGNANQSYGPVSFRYATGGGGGPTRVIGLSGNLAFGDVTVGGTLQRTLTIANTGNASLTVSGLGYPSGFSGDWSGGTIAAGASQTVTVTFAPTLLANYSGNITVTSDATAGTNTIAVAGTGIAALPTAFVTSFAAGTVRNNYSGWVGMQIIVGASPVTVRELGRIVLTGNSGTHTVKLVRASDGQDVVGGAVALATAGGTAGQIKYATLASPVVLTANTAYYLLTQETFGGDTWCDLNTTVTTTGVATVPTAAYGTGPGAWVPFGNANQSYGPVGFRY